MSEVLMPYIVVFGFAFTLSINSHVRTTIILDLLPVRAQKAITIFMYFLSCCTCMWLVWFSWIKFWRSFMINEEMMAAIRIPWWIGKFALPVGMAVFGIRYLIIIIKKEV
jgi:TRAP-type C4-dicarboxylate transport system permease small subunit